MIAAVSFCAALSSRPVQAATVTSIATGNWSGAATSAWPLTNRTGSVTSSNVSTAVLGSGTSFTTELTTGNVLSTQSGTALGTVASITDNTHLALSANASNTVTGQTYRSNGVGSGDAAVISSGNTITMDLTNATVTSVSLASPSTANNGLTIPTGNSLTVTTSITFTANASANAQTITLQGTGNLSAASVVTSASTSTGAAVITCAAGATGLLTISGNIALVGSNVNGSGGSLIDFGTTSTACDLSAGSVTLTGGTKSAGLLKMGTGVFTLNGALTGAGSAVRAQFTTAGVAVIALNGGTIGTGETLAIAAGTDILSTGSSSITYGTAVTTWGDLTVSAGTLTFSGATGMVTSVTIASGATLASSTRLITNSGNYTNNGTHSGSAGMTMTGAAAILDGTGSYTNTGTLTLNTAAKSIAPTAVLTLAGPIAITGAITVTNNGILSVTSATGITGSVAGSTWVNSTNAVLNDAGPLLVNGTLTATATNNTVNYSGAAQTLKATTYYHLTVSGSGTKTMTGLTTVNGNFNSAGGTATVPLTTIGNDFSITGGTATLSANVTVGGALSITSGTLTTGNFTLGVTGDTTVAGTLTYSGNAAVTLAGNLTVNGTWSGAGTGTLTAKGDVTGSGLMSLTGNTLEQRVAANQNFGQLSGNTNWTFKNLTFSNSSGSATPVVISAQTGGTGGVTITGLLTLGKVGDTAGATTTLDPADIVWTLSGTGTVFTLTSNLGALCDPTTCADNTSLFKYTGATATAIGASTGYYDVLRNPTLAGAITDTTPTGPITAYHSFTLNPTKTVSAACLTLNLGGDLTIVTGALTLSGTTFGCSVLNTTSLSHYNVTAGALAIAQGPGAGATDNLIANSSLITLTGTGTPLTIGASLATFTRGTSTVAFTGDGATIPVLTGTGPTNTYFNLFLQPSGATPQVIGAGTLDVNGDLRIGDGIHTGATASGNPTLNLYGNLLLAANAIYTKGSGTTTFKKGNTQTWTDNTSGSQDLGTVRVSVNGTNTTVTLGSAVEATALTIDASQTVSLNGSNTLAVDSLVNSGSLTGSAGTLSLAGTGTPFTNTGTYTYGTSTMRYTGNGATISALSGSAGTNGYYNLTLAPASSSPQVFGTAGGQTFQINNDLTVGDGVHAGATAATNNPSITVMRDVTIANGSTLTATTALFAVAGSWVNSGTFVANASTVTLNGITPGQTIQSSGSAFANLHINSASTGVWTLSDPLIVTSTLTLTHGTLDTGTNQAITLGGNWNEVSAFIFKSNAGTVNFTGTSAQKINSGGETFGFLVDSNTSSGGLLFQSSFSATNFTINSASLASPTTVYFTAGSTYTIATIAWFGSSTTPVVLRSTNAGQAWMLNNTGTSSGDYIDVKDSDAHTGQTVAGGPHSIDSGNNTNWSFLLIGVSFSPTSYGFGSILMGITTVSTSAITVTNLGNGTETYSLSVSTTLGTAWTVGTSTPTASDRFSLFGLFNSVLPSSNTFTLQDIIGETPTTASASVYAGNQSALSVPVNATRNFWMRLDMPLTTTTTSQMTMDVTITAASP